MYTQIAKKIYLPVLDRVKRTDFRGAYAEALRNERLDRAELARIQAAKLERVVRCAERHSPSYQRLWYANSEGGREAVDMTRFSELPLLTKEFVVENLSGLIAMPLRELVKGTTSGSTGISMLFYMNPEHVAWVLASQWRGRRWWGVERGDREFVLWGRPYERASFSDLAVWAKCRLRNTIQFSAFDDSGSGQVEGWLSVLSRFGPKVVYGYGSSLARLGDGLMRAGGAVRLRNRPEFLEYTADHMSEPERDVAASAFGAPVLSAYGASECGGIAQECRERRLHVSVDHVLLEVLGADGEPVPLGEVGELVVTPLHNVGMPLIRYRIGDLGALTGEECRCGSPLPVMRLQAGKAVDLVTTPERSGVSAHVLDYINMSLIRLGVRGVRQFFVEQRAPNAFFLDVVRDEPFNPQSVDKFVEKMRESFGRGIEVEVSFVEQIPLQATGKRRYFRKTFS